MISKLMNKLSDELLEHDLLGITLNNSNNEFFFYVRKSGSELSLIFNKTLSQVDTIHSTSSTLKNDIIKLISEHGFVNDDFNYIVIEF